MTGHSGCPATTWSIGEASALAVKAARGAGQPVGLAEEAGWAVRWLARHRLPGMSALARHLATPGPGACPLTLGAYLADAGAVSDPGLMDVAEPLLLVPFLSRVAQRTGALRATIAPRCFHVGADGTDLAGLLAPRARVLLAPARAEIDTKGSAHRIDAVTGRTLATLHSLAQRTYAPATDSSRAKGAGAGLTDND